ncbi:hypothetical protein ALC60_00122 [Trachymyrmex zeteki]|nr:hypothetical protein ALC60_00121 [Trachymyrmex zeteki]KYQ53595.1 hypothetical protein ALC60_00122 [Trachymyrmex zeteki]
MEQSKTEDVASDRIAETFAGRKILVTGGTGFLGKVLIEKLLRCLPDIEHIYIIVRPKKGKDPKHRLNEIFNSPVSSKAAFKKKFFILSKRVG